MRRFAPAESSTSILCVSRRAKGRTIRRPWSYLVGVLAVFVSSGVFAQVTYDFTGITTGTAWTGVTTGEVVSGTMTFNVTQALISGVVGSTSGWANLLQGGSSLGLPDPTSFVFSMTAEVFNGSNQIVASYTSSSPSLGLYEADSQIGGANSTQLFSATEEVWTTSSSYTSSGMQIHDLLAATYGPNGYPAPFNSNGTYVGDFWVVPNPFAAQYVNFNILTLAPALPVPEASPSLLLIAGLVVVAVIARRSRGRPLTHPTLHAPLPSPAPACAAGCPA